MSINQSTNQLVTWNRPVGLKPPGSPTVEEPVDQSADKQSITWKQLITNSCPHPPPPPPPMTDFIVSAAHSTSLADFTSITLSTCFLAPSHLRFLVVALQTPQSADLVCVTHPVQVMISSTGTHPVIHRIRFI